MPYIIVFAASVSLSFAFGWIYSNVDESLLFYGVVASAVFAAFVFTYGRFTVIKSIDDFILSQNEKKHEQR